MSPLATVYLIWLRGILVVTEVLLVRVMFMTMPELSEFFWGVQLESMELKVIIKAPAIEMNRGPADLILIQFFVVGWWNY